MMIYESIDKLAEYAVSNNLIESSDSVFARNRLLEALGLDSYEPCGKEHGELELEGILAEILTYAAEKGLVDGESIVSKDIFDTKLMGILTPRPSEVIKRFYEEYAKSPEAATDYYYALSKASDYIRTYRVKKDMRWVTETEYGALDITINLSKPEKDPKAIAAARKSAQSGYPKCLLCRENEGYAGRADHPARANHRIIPIEMNSQPWFLQYSPYVYYNEHCIAFNGSHIPMVIDRSAFCKLLDFVTIFPHYFIGSNADLPIVGGSILTHDHFQGGRYEFAMAKAPTEKKVGFAGYEDVEAGIVKWPLSVIRLRCENKERLVTLSDKILGLWREYTDSEAFVYARTEGEPHNTITPIARRRGKDYEIDLVLRNNITTKEHPFGVYHPHADKHHIKKENIGLIEVMGLAVLPARLMEELTTLSRMLAEGKNPSDDPLTEKHAAWAKGFAAKYGKITAENAMEIVKRETGLVFAAVLEDAGVYKCDEAGRAAFMRFINHVNNS